MVSKKPHRAAGRNANDCPTRWVVVCHAHGAETPAASIRKARFAMKDPASFCYQCNNIESGNVWNSAFFGVPS